MTATRGRRCVGTSTMPHPARNPTPAEPMTSPFDTTVSPAFASSPASRTLERTAAGLAVAGHHVDDLVFHHGVCVVGHGRAGHDAHALPGLDRAFKHVARRDLGHDVQFDRRFLRRLGKLGGPNREPVHRRMGERRDVDIALQIGGGHAADRFQHGHGFHRQGRRMGQHERTGLFK